MVESVYSAVRTDSLYKADYASSLKGKRAKSRAELNCVADGFFFVCVICNVQFGSSGEPPDLWSADARFKSGL